MYQAVMDGLYQKVAEFTIVDEKQKFELNLNFKSPYVALPKYMQSNEFLFGQLGKISVQNQNGSLELFTIGIEQAAVSSLVKHGIEKMEDRGEILNGIDVNVRLAMGKAFDIDVDFDSEPVLTVTKQAYEQILKSLDNIALPNNNQEESSIDSDEAPEKKQFKPIRASLNLHDLKVDMRDESFSPTTHVDSFFHSLDSSL